MFGLFGLLDLGATAAERRADRLAQALARRTAQQQAAATKQAAAAAARAAQAEARRKAQIQAKLLRAQKMCKAPASFKVTSYDPPLWSCERPLATTQPIPVQGSCPTGLRVVNGMYEQQRWNATTQACEWVPTGQAAPAPASGEPSLPPSNTGWANIIDGSGYGSGGASIVPSTGGGSGGASIIDGSGYGSQGASIVPSSGGGGGAYIVDNSETSLPPSSSAPAERLDECDPRLAALLPLEYPDRYGPMKVLRVVCS